MKRCEGPDCTTEFEPKRSTARYCTPTCRQRAGRRRKAVDAEARALATEGDDAPAEPGLVRAVRKELEGAEALETVPGQLAILLARKIANPEESGITAMSKELRALLTEAKGTPGPAPAPDGAAEAGDDEVTEARRRREEIAAAAAAAEGQG